MRNPAMGTARLSATGPATAAQAWERYARPELWSTWSPQIRGVETDVERLSTGATGTVLGPLGVRVAFVVDSFDEAGMRWVWTARVGPIRMHLAHGVDAAPTGCSTWLEARSAWPVLAAYLPIARFALHKLIA
ncbi:SRPBCC family protein [Allobranchiibius sp. GilTou73]|uniref:SRPBCC family protein n=1 Tax=Allobranchiibius sp. GilTou73 TaxID=2904523 RepID=UPI001F3CCDEB|nr:SRPBCC family protein [Allobranchiibius sp. GilTou73]UIJ34049.1 SRPBCC family protein [Allobranchiibius sp. GilTou73]